MKNNPSLYYFSNPQGSGYTLYLFWSWFRYATPGPKKDAVAIPIANTIANMKNYLS